MRCDGRENLEDELSEPGRRQELLERAAELRRLGEALESARGGAGAVIVIEGAAGIGKTALLSAARELAAGMQLQVLSARGRELEQEFAFGVARQLFEGPLARADDQRRAALLAGVAGVAAPLFEPEAAGRSERGASGRPPPDLSFTLTHGLYWLTANLADSGPLMIALDDAHYADAPSLQFIAYLGARCPELPVLIALTARSGEPSEVDALLAAIRADSETTLVEPATLSEAAVSALVRLRLGADAAPGFCAACGRVSAGNPFLLGELLAELDAEHVDPSARNVGHVDRVSPAAVSRAVLARLARLGADAAALARAAAILEKAPLQQIADLAELTADRARTAADALLAAQILTAAPLAFVHPLLRRAVYEQIPPAARADSHRRAALLLAQSGAPSTVVGAHLLRASPSGQAAVVGLLRRAAGDALAGGDPQTAAGLLRRALSEPPAADQRAAVLAELGGAEALAREPTAAEHLEEALELTIDPAARVRIACTLGDLLVWVRGDSLRAHAMLTRTLAELGDAAPPQLRAPLETVRSATASIDVRLVGEIEPRLDELHALARAAGPIGRELKIFEACWQAQRGPYDGPWRDLLDEGLDEGAFIAEHTSASPMIGYASIVLVLADELDRADALLADVRAEARARGSIHAHLVALAWGSFLALRRGELRSAAGDARAALELARGLGAMWAVTWMVACLAEALYGRGELEEAAAVIDQSGLQLVLGTSAALHALLARGRIKMGLGDRAGAVADLRLAGETVIVNNPSFVPWRSVLAVALAGADPVEARTLAEAELARARQIGQPRGVGVALRALATARGGGPDVIPLLEESVTILRDSPAMLELARSLLELGAAGRRAGARAAAREPLREALALAQRCGADGVAETARQELLASGAKPRRESVSGPDALTPSERRVAELAASGLANREIAQALFVTTKTVGTHLAHIYQKLDLGGPSARALLEEKIRGAT